jgi:hypothetical protein
LSHEFSIIVIIAATILLLAAVCGVLFWGVAQSKDIADMGYSAISDTVNMSDVILAVERKGDMPAAACYTILKDHPELIVRLDCRICGSVTVGVEVGDCIKTHMRGRVNLTLTEEESSGTYTATLTGG